MRTGRPPRPAEERFRALVDVRGPDECWPWLGFRNIDGYGLFCAVTTAPRRRVMAHRFAYELDVGPIPDEHTVDHRCHSEDDLACPGGRCEHRGCCNPRHLRTLTSTENVALGVRANQHTRKPRAMTR